MRMLVALLVAAAISTSVPPPASAQENAVPLDLTRSHARFSVSHVYVQHVTGTVPIATGSVVIAPGANLPERVTATLDARRVDTANKDRDEDLQGPDWFDTQKFPLWTFASTAIKPGAGGTFVVEGVLTVHGVAQPVSLAVTPGMTAGRTTFHAVGRVDRHAFAMRLTPIDGLIGNDVELTLDVTLAK